MTRAIDYWIWPLSMPDRFLNAKVHRACHALSIEDERDAFRPVIWDERYVRGTAVVPGHDKQNWLFGIDYDPRDNAAKAADPAPHLRTNLPPVDRERISQVWFTGVHTDIGGGYPQDGLSHVTLDWMLDRAEAYGLKYSAFQRQHICDPQINPFDKLNDFAQGVCWLLSLQATQHKGVLRGAALQAFVLGRYCCDVAVVAKSEGSAKGIFADFTIPA